MRLLRRQALLALGTSFVLVRTARADDAATDVQARWVAGVTAPKDGSAEWDAYAKAEDERWTALKPRLDAIKEFQAKSLAPILPAGRAVFYPFAGPDALHAIALFPSAPRVVLVGLEPVGTLPDPKQPAAGTFVRLGAALADLHRLTFFRTHEMQADFKKDGVLAALVATVVRMGGKVSSVTTASGPPSARIDWTDASGSARRLDYVQLDLANASLKNEAQFVADVHALAPYVAFVKAAMYLPAQARFSYLRQALLDDAAVIVQDDTGIPFRHFDSKWAVRLYGQYEKPVTPFEEFEQSDLRSAFEKRAVGKLPFGIGYSVEAKRSNLLVATKATP